MQAIQDFMDRHKLVIESQFVPLSLSRNKDEKNPTLNFRITLKRNGVGIVGTDYSMGSAHAPAYKRDFKGFHVGPDKAKRDAIAFECEHGHEYGQSRQGWGKPIKPNPIDVFACLIRDSDVLEHSGFESWARDLGYDTDSRKAESIYRECLVIALAIRAALGDAALNEARQLANEW